MSTETLAINPEELKNKHGRALFRGQLYDELDAILASAEKAGADELTIRQRDRFTHYRGMLDTLMMQDGIWDDSLGVEDTRTVSACRAILKRYDKVLRQPLSPYGQDRVLPGEAHTLEVPGDPFGIRALRPSERICREGSAGLSWGRLIRGLVTGDWRNAEMEQRALAEGVGSEGGYLVPTPLAGRVIDLARAKATVVQAGAATVPMDSNTLTIAKVASDPTASWRAENAAITASDMVFDRIQFSAKTLAALIKVSVELIEDSQLLAGTVENALSQALGLELDRAALYGSGAGSEPKGIKNTTGVQTYSMGTNGAALTNYSPFSQAVEKIATANGAANAAIYAPRTAGELDRLVDTTGQPMRPPQSFASLRTFATTQIPVNLTQGTANNASDAFVGDFSQLLIGMRTQIRIEVSREASDAASSAFANMQVFIRAYLRADIALAQPSHFCVITGIIPPT